MPTPKQKPAAPKRRRLTKKHWIYLIDALVIVLTIWLVTIGVRQMTINNQSNPCQNRGKEHQLTVKANVFTPSQITVTQCDAIKIINLDTQDYTFVFGSKAQHQSYPGFTQQTVRPNEFFIIDAIQTGTYQIHDHLRDKARIQIIIEPR